jgi:outer membrane protein OmpA-like peptidoglycan-associated protein
LVLFWYGPENPIVSNDTPENMAMNRRVEINVGGL